MDTILITGVGGLVGSTTAEHLHARGYSIIGIDNDLRGKLLADPKGSTQWNMDRLTATLPHFMNYPIDVRDRASLSSVFTKHGKDIKVIVHCAAQPAHEGKVREDFEVNAVGTLNLLELWYGHCPAAIFIYISTIKVYGSYPNTLEYLVSPMRFDLDPRHPHFNGFDEKVPIDQGMSSFFGRSKTAADLYVQEYAYQYGLRAVCFRASCLTGGLHSGTEAHGMLSYMMRCAYTKTPYRIYGYNGLQVRDQLHADDLTRAIEEVITNPKEHVVYNIGGGRANACSIGESIEYCERLSGNKMTYSHLPMRMGDHRWWITDNGRFMRDYPNWKIKCSLDEILQDIYDRGKRRWQSQC